MKRYMTYVPWYFSVTMLMLVQRQVTIFIIFWPPRSLYVPHCAYGRWWNVSHETKFCFLWKVTHLPLKPDRPQYTTANLCFRVNKIILKRRECPGDGFSNSPSPRVCECEFDAHERNGLLRWPRARLFSGRRGANFSGNSASTPRPFCFLCRKARSKHSEVS